MSANDLDPEKQLPPLGETMLGESISAENSENSLQVETQQQDIHRVTTVRSARDLAFDDLVRKYSTRGGQASRTGDDLEDTMADIFNREEEKHKHVGVIFRDVTVQGIGIGTSIQPTVSELFRPNFSLHKTKPIRTILNKLTGCVRDGEMLLVLARPEGGSTTFLKTLANLHEGYEKVDGNITYGGVSSSEMREKYRGEIVYNQEDDIHYATLNVKQTLDFAVRQRTPEKRTEGESRKEYKLRFREILTKIFGLAHVLHTKIGNEYIRGISGGEKKRASIAETMVTRPAVGCWDNSTRGLDATAVEYVRSLRVLTNMTRCSTIVAIYQAGESLYNMFDKVILLDHGKCIFFGRSEDAKAYFLDLGFECPDRQTTADFLTSVTDSNARVIRNGAHPPLTPDELEQKWHNSPLFQTNEQDVVDFENQLSPKRESTGNSKKGIYTASFSRQIWNCTIRQYQVTWGDKPSLIGKNASAMFQALIVGSLFYNQQKTSAGAFTRGGTLFFALLFNALLALAELSAAFQARPILLKHKSFTFYRPAAFAVAQLVADIPVIFIQIMAFNLILYFLSGLQRTASQFFINSLFLYISTMTILDIATRLSGLSIQAIVVYSGYLIPRPSMHPWLYWIFYINPLSYAFDALMSNEFYNLELQCVVPQLVPFGPGYNDIANKGCSLVGSEPGSATVSGARYIELSFTYSRSHLWRNFGIILAWWALFTVVTMIGMENFKPHRGGGAVTIFKRGGTPKHVQDALVKVASDEEVGQATSHHESEIKEEVKGMAGSTSIFTWKHVNYIIPYQGGTRTLLNDVQGWVKPGRLTALVGQSGAGKTTLLNALAQRISTGVITGDILVDGRPLGKSFQRSTGYVEQMDIHEPTSTVREALRFSALLRQPKETPVEEKYEYVEKVIKLLEMEDLASAAIGRVGEGLSVEQRKRVTIGVELASKPQLLLFLDEPTSGLDSQSAFNVIRFIRKLSQAGQAILCTIHQPSALLFEHFDDLLILGAGGHTLYFGELGKDSQTLIKYFEDNGASKCPPNANPAEYCLEVVGAGATAKVSQDWAEIWRNSELFKKVTLEIEHIINERGSKKPSVELDEKEFAVPWTIQFQAVLMRTFAAYWREPQYIIGKVLLHITTALFNTFTFWKQPDTIIGMQNRLFSIFITLTIAPPLIQQLQPRFLAFRDIFSARERASKIYHWTALILSTILVEIPWSAFCGTIYFLCWYFGTGFPTTFTSGFYVWMSIVLFTFYYVSLGQMIAAFSPNELFASILVPFLFSFIVGFCGVLSPPDQIPTFWRSWMYPLSPFHYLLEGILSSVIHNVPVQCSSNEFATFLPPSGQTCQQYANQFLQMIGSGYLQDLDGGLCGFCPYSSGDQYGAVLRVFYYHRWRDYGIFWGYVIFDFALVFVGTWIYLGGFQKLFKKTGEKRSLKSGDVANTTGPKSQ
ncbi:Brefeldin A resistance protein [Neolecta irregularis DAH-3]|uniref:Brefeldin A resistance protein n=1 Tax=Neolecta irregularis (strain DAH-3) TaxID=1198029 RepID=A0A1U7LGI9_NEOID|nr:Brefeldin A resistance protein [Neolecta irregularis DAH-3]|eukprot:OLL21759.1 Brefeldin A resistance protein [Neolecta irregularis DAH-3]